MSKHKISSNIVEKAFAFALLNVMIDEKMTNIHEHPPNPNETEDSKSNKMQKMIEMIM